LHYLKKIKWIINRDGTWKVLEDGKVKYRGRLTVDPAKKPKTIDSTLAGDQESKGIRCQPLAIHFFLRDNF
jgi:hypothetical protein